MEDCGDTGKTEQVFKTTSLKLQSEGSTGSDDLLLTINTNKKDRKRKRKRVTTESKKRSISFDLKRNMTREFHKHAKVMTRSL